MYRGTKPVAELEPRATRMSRLDTEPMTIPDVEIVKVAYETEGACNEALLPAGLHPTIPPTLTWLVLACAESPFGPFRMVQTRIGCRSGVRPRAFVVGTVVDSTEASKELGDRWGFMCDLADIDTGRRYDHAYVKVERDGEPLLALDVSDPNPLRSGDIQWIASMNLALTPSGTRLIQCDCDYEVKRAERGRPILHEFDAGAWGEPLITLTYPIAASLAVADVRFPRIRYVCKPDELAFTGTEVVGDRK